MLLEVPIPVLTVLKTFSMVIASHSIAFEEKGPVKRSELLTMTTYAMFFTLTEHGI